MQIPGLSVGIVADDLTGACDTALQFFSSHASTHVLLDLHHPDQAMGEEKLENQVWAINTSSRHTNPLEAQALARQAVALLRDRFGVVNFYKKVDSTLRGQLAHECLGLLDELRAQCAVIAPAYPQEGRRTVGGYQLVRGIPVEKTAAARDPLFPIRQSHLPTILEQASKPEIVGHIPLSVVLHGAGPVLVKLNELIKEGKKLVVVDATSAEDLEQVALAIEKAQKTAKVLPCGSAGLAHALTELWGSEPEQCHPAADKSLDLGPPQPILMVSGSNSEVTRQQIARLVENYAYYGQASQVEVVEINADQVLGLAPIEPVLEQIRQNLGTQNTVVVTTALREESYSRTIHLAREHQITEEQASHKAQALLAQVTQRITEEQVVRLVLTGGETTCEVCEQLGTMRLEIVAEVEPSIPLSRDQQGRWIVTKSGGFGSPMSLANVVKFIKHREMVHVG